MLISEVRLYKFRSYRNASVCFGPGINIVVGPNNAGKSNLLVALNLLLGERYPRRDDISNGDFYMGPDQDGPSPVLGIAVRLGGGGVCKDTVKDWGGYVEKWPPKSEAAEVTESWTDDWWTLLAEPMGDGKKWMGGNELAEFLERAAEKGELWLYLACQRDEEGEFSYGLLVRSEDSRWHRVARIRGAVRDGLITAAYLPAFRSPNEALRITEWNWYGKMVRELYRRQRGERAEEFKQAEEDLSRLVQEAFDAPSKALETLLQRLVPDIQIRFKAGPFTADDAHKSITLFLDDGVDSPHAAKGAGLQSLLVVTLFRFYCEQFHQCGSVLLIEEPENHLHPHGRRVLAYALKEFASAAPGNRQVIVTTHSESLVQMASADGLRVVRRKREGSRFWELPMDHEDFPRWRQIIRRSPELVFADHVILVEGGEVHLLPVLALKLPDSVEGGGLERRNISVVRVEGKRDFKKHISLLEALGIGWTILTDKDFLDDGIEQVKERLDCLEHGESYDTTITKLKEIGVFVNPLGNLEDLYTADAQKVKEKQGKDRALLFIASKVEEGSALEDWFCHEGVSLFREVIEHAVQVAQGLRKGEEKVGEYGIS